MCPGRHITCASKARRPARAYPRPWKPPVSRRHHTLSGYNRLWQSTSLAIVYHAVTQLLIFDSFYPLTFTKQAPVPLVFFCLFIPFALCFIFCDLVLFSLFTYFPFYLCYHYFVPYDHVLFFLCLLSPHPRGWSYLVARPRIFPKYAMVRLMADWFGTGFRSCLTFYLFLFSPWFLSFTLYFCVYRLVSFFLSFQRFSHKARGRHGYGRKTGPKKGLGSFISHRIWFLTTCHC